MGRDDGRLLEKFLSFGDASNRRRGQVVCSDGGPARAKFLDFWQNEVVLSVREREEGLAWLSRYILNRPWRTLANVLAAATSPDRFGNPALTVAELRHLFAQDGSRGPHDNLVFAGRLASVHKSGVVRCAGVVLHLGLQDGSIVCNLDKETFEMSDNTTGYTNPSEITGLMWQVAMANWENTRGHLSLPQLETMAKLSLQALFASVFPGSAQAYDVAEVNRGMEKVETVLGELNARMTVEKGKLLGGKP